MDGKAILSEKLEDELETIEWIKREYAKIQAEEAQLAQKELREHMEPYIQKKDESDHI